MSPPWPPKVEISVPINEFGSLRASINCVGSFSVWHEWVDEDAGPQDTITEWDNDCDLAVARKLRDWLCAVLGPPTPMSAYYDNEAAP